MKRSFYADYIAKAVALGEGKIEEQLAAWKKSMNPDAFLGLYSGPKALTSMAHLEGFLYRVKGERKHAEQARHYLLQTVEAKQHFPEATRDRHPEYQSAIPTAEPMFILPYYIYGYLYIKDSEVLSAEDRGIIEEGIADSLRFTFHYPEWGAHNRCMLRVWSLTLAISAAGSHPEAAQWKQMRDILVQDTWGQWSIEDAEMYLSFWLKSAIDYAVHTDQEEAFFKLPQTRYYFDYITRLITPYGQVPDFGDAHFNSYWFNWAAILEKGASAYKCGHMKYAAERIVEFGMSYNPDANTGVGTFFALAYEWCDDTIEPVCPDWKSGEVLEDLIGKKMAFRSGWGADDLYMLYNYRDEGDFSFIAREYLRNTISVKAEKMHHGHSDENTVQFLSKGRSILLNEAGYRENVPNGKYRADIYHNRLVFRREARNIEEGAFEALHDNGFYKPSRTEKLHWQSFDGIDYSRTRWTDENLGILWDRSITYLHEEERFIVVDGYKSLKEGAVTVGNLWHTEMAETLSEGCYDTSISHIPKGIVDPNPYKNDDEYSLLIEFVGRGDLKQGAEKIRRGYTESTLLYELESRTCQEGEMGCFVTVLSIKEKTAAAGNAAASTAASTAANRAGEVKLAYLSQQNDAISVISEGKRKVELIYKLDLDKGLSDKSIYPRYTWQNGKIKYGNIETDADFAYVRTSTEIKDSSAGDYGFVNGCGLEYQGEKVFQTPQMSSYNFEKSGWDAADHKWRAWYGELRSQGRG